MAQVWPPLRPGSASAPAEPLSTAARRQQQQLLDSFRGSLRDYELGTTKLIPPGASWQSMREADTILPDLTAAGHDLIERWLGYRPHIHMLQLHDAFLRVLRIRARAISGATNTEARWHTASAPSGTEK